MAMESLAQIQNRIAASLPQKPQLDPSIVQQVLLGGDLSKLNAEQRISFYNRVCESLGLNPLTQPFAYLKLSGKEVLYAKKDATEQLRFIHGISIDPAGFTREVIEGVYVVTAPASMPSGRTDVSTGAVAIDGLKGENRANAMMKAETKAKRRVTLSICGLGMLDETEVETIRQEPPPLVVEAAKNEPEPPAGAVYIRRIEQQSRKTRNGGTFEWADVTFHNGEIALAKGAQLVGLLEQIAQDREPVVVTVEPNKKGFAEITEAVRWKPELTPEQTSAIIESTGKALEELEKAPF
jgi:hypothetical protein